MAAIHNNLQTVFSMCEVPQEQDKVLVDPVDEEKVGRVLRDVVIVDTHLDVKFDKELDYKCKKVSDISTLIKRIEGDIAEEGFTYWFHRVVEAKNCFNFQGFLLMNFLGVKPPRIRARPDRRNGRRRQAMVMDLQKKELLLILFAKNRLIERGMEDRIATAINKLFPYRTMAFVRNVLNSIETLDTVPIQNKILENGEIAQIFKMCIMAMEDEDLDILLFSMAN